MKLIKEVDLICKAIECEVRTNEQRNINKYKGLNVGFDPVCNVVFAGLRYARDNIRGMFMDTYIQIGYQIWRYKDLITGQM
ncbi:hypothetical protein J6590_008621 [Homalodisca vitripennis]|nr:hypothetical protein J6590_008621 [Homalodisca vitripennis]